VKIRSLTMLFITLMMISLGATNVFAGSLNGSAGQMPAYYDGKLFTINFASGCRAVASQP
jgi:hypothetical protein